MSQGNIEHGNDKIEKSQRKNEDVKSTNKRTNEGEFYEYNLNLYIILWDADRSTYKN